jgi:endonuclease/exonuclease/phosphatase family metal-dependent hydrolase
VGIFAHDYMRFFFLFFPLFLNAIELKIASYNVENLFDMRLDGTEYRQYRPNRDNWTDATLNKKLKNISEVICDIDADIIGLQEIENQNSLRLLQKALKRYGCRYRYSAITHKKGSAIQVALLSKIPIDAHRDIVVKRFLGQRNILEVRLMVDSYPLYIFVNHWNSKKSPESKRVTSALALKKRLLSLPKGSEYILLGDFNSNYDEYKKVEKTGINHTLSTIDSNNRLIRASTLKPNKYQHTNLWLELPIYKRWSYNFYGKKEGLDGIILPYSLLDGRGIDYVDNSFHAFKHKYLFTSKGYVFRWEYKRKKHTGRGYSDHMAVLATFSTNPYRGSNGTPQFGTIGRLYQQSIVLPLLLKKIKVVSLEKKSAVIEQESGKKSIIIYGVNGSLELNKIYDIVVFRRKLYKGQYEIVDFSIKKRYDGIKKME